MFAEAGLVVLTFSESAATTAKIVKRRIILDSIFGHITSGTNRVVISEAEFIEKILHLVIKSEEMQPCEPC